MENYRGVIKGVKSAPLCCQGESPSDKTKANDHIPSPQVRNRVGGVADVVNDDPDQANEEAGEHQGSEPFWALRRKWSFLSYLIRNVDRILLAIARFRHE